MRGVAGYYALAAAIIQLFMFNADPPLVTSWRPQQPLAQIGAVVQTG